MSESPTCPDCGAALAPGARATFVRAVFCAGLASPSGIVAEHDQRPSTVDQGTTTPGVLDALAVSTGVVSRILLRDTDNGFEPPLIRPDKNGGADSGVRYRIDGEIARGGMGQVLKGRDPDLGRDVALKVLREDFRDDLDMVRRFVEEAQIGGQLQHPGIVPIYELGLFGDRRPFFAMKLVKGDTLAKLLDGRKSPAEALPRFLGIFEAIAQTVAYGHARGVIHRDLKPSNVMVGSFGEVQVMDWGLAKVLPRGGVSDGATAGKVTRQETVIATARSGSDDSDLSRAGSAMGTPSYMAPEQARGEIDRINERADVFALGSILCEILTGQPAFIGRSSGEIQRKAALGDLAEAMSRLDTSGADRELVAIAKDCLAREPEDRPRAAGVVAEGLSSYLAGVQQRLRVSELERAAEHARAEETLKTAEASEARAKAERNSRRLTAALAACVVGLITLGAGGYSWMRNQKAERAARTASSVDRAARRGRTCRHHSPQRLAQLGSLMGRGGRAGTESRRPGPPGRSGRDHPCPGVVCRGTAGRGTIQGRLAGTSGGRRWPTRRPADPGATDDDRSRPGPGGDRVDLCRRVPGGGPRPGWPPRRRRAGTPSPPGRGCASRSDGPGRLGRVPPPLAGQSRRCGSAVTGSTACRPRSLALRTSLSLGASRPHRAPGSTAPPGGGARTETLGPVSLDFLGRALIEAGAGPAAEKLLIAAQRRYPGDAWLNYDIGFLSFYGDRFEKAIPYLATVRAFYPESAHMLGHCFVESGELDEAEAVYRDLARLQPDIAIHRGCLGRLLRIEGRSREGDAVLNATVASVIATLQRGTGREDLRDDHLALLQELGKASEMEAASREAIRRDPSYVRYRFYLAISLSFQRRYQEAESVISEAIRIKPDYGPLYIVLGTSFRHQGRLNDAITAYRKARELRRTKPDTAAARELDALTHRTERQQVMAPRLSAILRGDDHPKDLAERIDLAEVCLDRDQPAAAFRFFAEALSSDPSRAEARVGPSYWNWSRASGRNLDTPRYEAARAAVLAGTGRGLDTPTPNDPARARFRGQALAYLRQERAAWGRELDRGDAASVKRVRRAFESWFDDFDLNVVRLPESLKALPETERADWQAFWDEVDETLQKAAKIQR